MSTILTASEAKIARESLGLSQGSVASVLNINRSYLSLFEGEKYLFDDNTLNALRGFYKDEGHSFSGDELTEEEPLWMGDSMEFDSPRCRVMDGIEIPLAVSDSLVEDLLSRRAENLKEIKELCAKQVKLGWFDDIDKGDLNRQLEKVTMLLASNEIIIQQLQGRFNYKASDTESKTSETTVGNALASRFSDYIPETVSADS